MLATEVQITSWPAVAAVAISTVGVVSTGLFAYLSSRSGRKTKQAIGVPNGMGNVVQMAERTLIEIGKLAERIEMVDDRLDLQEERYQDHAPAFKQLLAQSKRHEEVLQKLVDKPQTVSILPVAVPSPPEASR